MLLYVETQAQHERKILHKIAEQEEGEVQAAKGRRL
jgi:hypothetical protein